MKKILFGVAALGLLGLAGAGVGLKPQDLIEAKATVSDSCLRGGEIHYVVDKASMIVKGTADLRIRFWDSAGNVSFSEAMVAGTDSFTANLEYTSYNTYRIVVPEYTGDAGGSWESFAVYRYKSENSSDTVYNYEHQYNQSGDLPASTYKDYRAWWLDGYSDGIVQVGKSNPSEFYGATSGLSFYAESAGWAKANSSNLFAIYFFDAVGNTGDTNGYENAWVVLDDTKKVLGTGDNYSDGLWEFTVPASWSGKKFVWHKYIFVELKTGETEGSWDNKQAQSSDIVFNDKNIIKGGNSADYNLADTTRNGYFATYFLDQTSVCDKDGLVNNITDEIWNNATAQYPKVRSAADAFKAATADEDSESKVEQAAARYDYIVGKYSRTDFAKRTPAPIVPSLNQSAGFSIENNNLGTISIVITASVLLGAGVLIVARKRRAE